MKTKTTTATKEPRTRATARPSTTPIPPIVLALAHLADPETDCIGEKFLRAWESMPEIVQAHAQGHSYDVGFTTRHAVLEQIIGDEIKRSRTATDDWDRRFAEIHDLLEAHDPDARATLLTPYVETSYMIGVAFAAYVLAGGALPQIGGVR